MLRWWNWLSDDVQWGLIWASGAAGFFSLIALGIWFVMVVATGDLSPWASMDVLQHREEVEGQISLWEILVVYWGAGLPAGALTGWLRPLAARSWWGAIFVGIVVGFIVAGAFILAIVGLSQWNRSITNWWLMWSVIFGPFYAVLIKYRYSGQLRKTEEGDWEIDPD